MANVRFSYLPSLTTSPPPTPMLATQSPGIPTSPTDVGGFGRLSRLLRLAAFTETTVPDRFQSRFSLIFRFQRKCIKKFESTASIAYNTRRNYNRQHHEKHHRQHNYCPRVAVIIGAIAVVIATSLDIPTLWSNVATLRFMFGDPTSCEPPPPTFPWSTPPIPATACTPLIAVFFFCRIKVKNYFIFPVCTHRRFSTSISSSVERKSIQIISWVDENNHIWFEVYRLLEQYTHMIKDIIIGSWYRWSK